MNLDAVCFYQPRKRDDMHPYFATIGQYKQLMNRCKKSAERFGYSFRHIQGEVGGPTCLNKTYAWAVWAEQATNPFVLIDPDCVILRPLDTIFQADFDVALTCQNDPRHPYNAGVLFCRNGENTTRYFNAIKGIADGCSSQSKLWGCDQDALAWYSYESDNGPKVIGFKAREGSEGNIYNFTPETKGRARKIPKEVYIVHWRGRRKKWK